jgi:hypothetical protein
MNIQSTVKSLDFTGNDDHVIKTKQPERVAPHRPEYLEQNRGLSMNDFSTPAKSGVVQFVDVHDLIRSKTPLEAAEIALRLVNGWEKSKPAGRNRWELVGNQNRGRRKACEQSTPHLAGAVDCN